MVGRPRLRPAAGPHASRPFADLCACGAHDPARARVRAAMRLLRGPERLARAPVPRGGRRHGPRPVRARAAPGPGLFPDGANRRRSVGRAAGGPAHPTRR